MIICNIIHRATTLIGVWGGYNSDEREKNQQPTADHESF